MGYEGNSLIFEQIFCVLPLVKDLIRGDLTMGVCDREKYVFSLINPKIDTGVKAGMPVKPGTAIARAMEEKKLIQIRGDKEKFGVPYMGAAVPIFNDKKEVIGAIAFVESVDTQDAVYEMASQIAEAVNHVADTIQAIGTMAVKLDHIAERLSNKFVCPATCLINSKT